MVESFDGTPLATTLTLPAGVKKGERLPLIVFLHGFLSNKGEYISDTKEDAEDYKTVEFNNLWFASRGYAVLNYYARGHGDSGGQIALASKDVEIRDTQHLTGLLVDDGTAKRRKVAAVGGSYGGGQTWLLATVRGKGAPQYGTWRSPKGKVVRLAAAVPQFTWTDLLFSLVPNGLNAKPTPLGRGEDHAAERLHRPDRHEDDRRAGGLARAREPGRALRRRPGRRGGEEGAHRGPLAPTTRTASSRRSRAARSASARSRSSPPRAGPTRSSPRSRRCACTSGCGRSGATTRSSSTSATSST